MRAILPVLSSLALVGLAGSALLFFADVITADALKRSLLAVTALWFVTTPFWMGRTPPDKAQTAGRFIIKP